MKRISAREIILSAIFVLMTALGGVATASRVRVQQFLVPTEGPAASPSFQKILHAEPGTLDFERARIDYLLERISDSPYNFIRNGGRYTGKRAAAHLKWKYFLNIAEIKTAEDFVNHVAARSKISGDRYFFELPDKKRYPVQEILMNELEDLSIKLQEARAKTSGPAEVSSTL